ncbi:hypothetical protein RclHR1_02020006 [Rhizophagus clarus]|nr:hypothetical protein RclHR1_02020006 [Rhizophagus clarus]
MCGQGFTGMVAQTLKRGPTGTNTDVATELPQSYIQKISTVNLTTGDWTNQTGTWPCFIFNPGNNIFFKTGVIDQIILLGLVNNKVNSGSSGLIFGIFDKERNLSSIEPFISPIPSINTYTFTRNERLDDNNILHSYFFVNKQNIVSIDNFQNPNLAAKFAYSPDTYLVQNYTEKVPYTPYDLISAVGGLTTYALAIWFVLFGRGKYRSWGLIQRYVLRNSPDARKKDNHNSLLPYTNEKSRDTDNNSTLVGSKNFEDERPSSTFYFSSSGTPTQSRFINSISPNSVITSSYYSTKELNKRIDAKINQKLWFVEQTLNRHYLSGFKLRRYDVDLKKLGFDTSYDDDNDDKMALTPPTIHHNWNNIDSNVQTNQTNHKSIQISPSLTHYDSRDSINPEEQRTQYPNVAIGQVPLEKKQRGRNSGAGSGNYQQFVNTSTNDATGVATTSPSQSGNVNNHSTRSSKLQIPLSLQSGVISNQEQVQSPPLNTPQGQDPSQSSPQGQDPSQSPSTQGPLPEER